MVKEKSGIRTREERGRAPYGRGGGKRGNTITEAIHYEDDRGASRGIITPLKQQLKRSWGKALNDRRTKVGNGVLCWRMSQKKGEGSKGRLSKCL